jgi:hypothetical protein
MFYCEEEWFTVSVSNQNNRPWSTENPHAAHELLLQYLKIRNYYGENNWARVSF